MRTRKKYLNIMMAFLIVSLSMKCFAKELNFEELSPETLTENRAEICLDGPALENLRGYKTKCDLCQADLLDTRATLKTCADAGKPSSDWWADPKIVVGGMVVTLSLGVLLGVLVAD